MGNPATSHKNAPSNIYSGENWELRGTNALTNASCIMHRIILWPMRDSVCTFICRLADSFNISDGSGYGQVCTLAASITDWTEHMYEFALDTYNEKSF